MDLPLNLALFLMGSSFIIAQVVVIRELLVVFAGNELSIAIILANWLVWGALGSYLTGKKAEDFRLGRGSFACLQALQALFLPATLLGIRLLREMMGLSPGEGASLGQVLSFTAALLAPLGMAGGAMFSLGCALCGSWAGRAGSSVGRVYLLEALGAGLGGGVYTFVLTPQLHSFQIAYLLGCTSCLSGLLLVRKAGDRTGWARKILGGGLLGLLGGSLLLLVFPRAWDLESLSLNRQWPGFSILETAWSPFGSIVVSQREGQLTFFSNGLPVLTAPVPDTAQVEELVHVPLLSHDAPERILVVGGGLGGVISEALKHPVNEVHLVELDPWMIELLRKYSTSLTRSEMEDPKVTLHTMDGRLFIKTAPGGFDLVLVNLPGPFTLQLNRFYTVEFFQEASRILRKKGIIAFPLPGAEAYFSREVRDLNMSLLESLKAVFPSVWVIPGNVNLILASPAPGQGPVPAALLMRRLQERNLATHFLTLFHLERKMDPARRKWMEDSFLRGAPPRTNLDSRPSGLYYGIAYWNAEFHPAFQKFWSLLGRIPLSALMVFLILLIGGSFALWGRRPGTGGNAVLLAVIGTTGFFGMGVSVLVIFSFQTLYGFVYQWIGLLIAVFMAGLAGGSWQMTRRLNSPENLRRTLGSLEFTIVSWSVLGMALLWACHSFPPRFIGSALLPAAFLVWNGLAGFLVGFEFPLVSALWTEKERGIARGAGTLYGADLLGAWAGALLVGVILIPVFGLWPTFGVFILLKTGGWLWVRLTA